MKMEEFERMNSLSEKALIESATPNELQELKQLLTIWNESTEYNLIQGIYTPNSANSLLKP
jgi:hypothetical protein